MRVAPADPHEPITPEMWEAIRAKWPDGQRLAAAWALARDVDALADLLADRPVDPSRIDQAALAAACQARLVQLVRPVDLLLEGAG